MDSFSDDAGPFSIADRTYWRGRDIESRLRFLEYGLFVPYPEFLSAIRWLADRARRCIKQNRGSCVFVMVPPGGGKTTLARFFKTVKPDQVLDEKTLMPVISFSIPSVVTIKRMTEAALESMGAPMPRADYSVKKNIIPLIQSISTEIIFIDNVQDVPEKRRIGGIAQIGSWIRDFSDDSKRLVVLLGTREAVPVINGSPQLKRRSIARKEIRYFDVTSDEGRARFGLFLKKLGERLPLAKEQKLHESPLLNRLIYATGGVQDLVIQLCSAAISDAFTSGTECLTNENFAAAFEQVFADAGRGLNPFSGAVTRIIDIKGEPLYELLHPSLAKAEPAEF